MGLRRRFPLSFTSVFLALGAPKNTAEQIESEKETAANRHQGHLIPHGHEQLRVGMGGVCARQDNRREWRRVIEISIKEVVSGVIAEVLWFVFVCEREWMWKNGKSTVEFVISNRRTVTLQGCRA